MRTSRLTAFCQLSAALPFRLQTSAIVRRNSLPSRLHGGSVRAVATSRYAALDSLPKAPASLDDSTRTIVLAAGHVAAGNLNETLAAFASLPKAKRPQAFDLAVLQNIAFSGLPRALNASATLQQAGLIEQPHASNTLNSADRRGVGETVFRQVYNNAADKVRTRLSSFHPDIESWAIEFAYGTVMAARVPELVSLRERELCAIATLAGLNVPPLMVGHLKGALNVGATKAEIRAVLDHTELVFGRETAEQVDAVWATFERARYAL